MRDKSRVGARRYLWAGYPDHREGPGGSLISLSGVLATRKVFEAVEKGSGVLVHGHKFQTHPTACAAAVEVQRIVAREMLLDNVVQMGVLLEQELKI